MKPTYAAISGQVPIESEGRFSLRFEVLYGLQRSSLSHLFLYSLPVFLPLEAIQQHAYHEEGFAFVFREPGAVDAVVEGLTQVIDCAFQAGEVLPTDVAGADGTFAGIRRSALSAANLFLAPGARTVDQNRVLCYTLLNFSCVDVRMYHPFCEVINLRPIWVEVCRYGCRQ